MKNIFKKLKEEQAFTLLEMTIVIMIIAALLLLIIPNVSKVNDKTDKTTGEAVVNTVDTQIMLYKMDNPNTSDDEIILQELLKNSEISNTQYNTYKKYKNK